MATTTADNVLRDIRRQADITFWLIAIKRKLADATLTAVERDYLHKMRVEFIKRLPA